MTDQAKDGHQRCLDQFEEAFEQTTEERKDGETCRDYYDGKQLTPDELAKLAERRQPAVISNRIKPKIDALLGFERKQRTDPKAYPRTPKHEQEAQSVTDAIRFVCDQNRFPLIRSEAAEFVLIEGIGAATVTAVPGKGGQMDVRITPVPWDRFYRDPHSRKRDFSDANYLGTVLWMDEADAKEMFPGKEDVIGDAFVDNAVEGETYDDRPTFAWSDRKRRRVRVLQHRYKQGGKWMTAIVCKGGYLRDPQPSPYVDEDGIPECDLIAVSAFVDRENRRYGAVKMMISPQDEINKRRSKALHLLNSRLVIMEEGATPDLEQTRREVARPDGVVFVHPNARFEMPDPSSLVAGQFELLQESKAEIDASGVNPALEGDLKAPSGRAVEALTQAGLAEQAIAFDALKDWSWRVYKAVWHRIRQYWTEERWVRVTDDERNLRWVGINAPATDEQTGQPMLGPDGRPQLQNVLGELDIDLILEDGPDSVTIQSEQFEQLVELKKADPTSIPTEAIIQASSLRNKDAILEKLQQGGIPPQVQEQMQAMQEELQKCQQELQAAKADQQQAQGEMALKAAELQLKDREIALKEAERELKLVELQIKQFEAETDRIQALKPDPAPTEKDN